MKLVEFVKLAAKAGLSAGGSSTWASIKSLFPSLATPSEFVPLGVSTDVSAVVDPQLRDKAGTPVAELKANVVHRTGTLASLSALVSPVGEVAVATDVPAVVLVTAAGGKAIYQGGPGGIRPADFINGIPGYFGAGQTVLTLPLAGTGGTPGITTPGQLADFLEACTYDQAADVIVQLQKGDYSRSGALAFFSYFEMPNVTFRGHKWDIDTVIASAVSAASGTQFDFSVTLVVPSSAQFEVGDYAACFPDPTATAANDMKLAGAWKVTAVPDATHVTIHYLGDSAPAVAAFIVGYTVYSLSSIMSFSVGGGYTLRRMLCPSLRPSLGQVNVASVGVSSVLTSGSDIVVEDLPSDGSRGIGFCLSDGGTFNAGLQFKGSNGNYLVCNDPRGNGFTLNNGSSGSCMQLLTVAAAGAASTIYLPAGTKASCLYFQQCNSGVGALLGPGASLTASVIVSTAVTTPYQAEAGTPLALNTMGPQLQFVAANP